MSSNIVGDSNYENNFLHKLLLTNTQVRIPLGLTAAASATDATIHKEMFESGRPRMLASRPMS